MQTGNTMGHENITKVLLCIIYEIMPSPQSITLDWKSDVIKHNNERQTILFFEGKVLSVQKC